MRGKIIIIFFIGLIFLTGCKSEGIKIPDIPLKMVSISKLLELKELKKSISYPASVVSSQEVKVLAKSSGIVKNIFFDLGDEVNNGFILADLDESDNAISTSYQTALQAKNNTVQSLSNMDVFTIEQVNQAEVALSQAEAAYNLAKKNYNSTKSIVGKDLKQAEIAKNRVSTGKKNIDDVTNENYKSAEIALETASVAFEQAKNNLENKKILMSQEKTDLITNTKNSLKSISDTCKSIIEQIRSITGSSIDTKNNFTVVYESKIGIMNQQLLMNARSYYVDLNSYYSNFSLENTQNINDNIGTTMVLVQKTQKFVDSVKLVFDNTLTYVDLSSTTLSSLQTTVSGYQSQINGLISQMNVLSQSLNNIDLNQQLILDSLEKTTEMAQKQLNSAKQSINNLSAGNTSQKDQANFEVQSTENQYESTKTKLQSQLDSSKTQMNLSELQLKNARIALDNAKNARKSQVDGIKSQLDSITGQMNIAKIQFDNLKLKSPITGTITKKIISVGDFINVGQPIAIINQTKSIKIQFFIDQENFNLLSSGMIIDVYDNDDKISSATITSFSPQADFVTKKFQVEAFFIDDNINILPGRIVTVYLTVLQKPKSDISFFIPLEALSISQNENTIFIYENGIAKKIPVKILKIYGESAEIEADINKDVSIIIGGSKFILNNEKVQVTN